MNKKKCLEGSEDHLLSDRINKVVKNGWFIFFTIRRTGENLSDFDITTNDFVKIFVKAQNSSSRGVSKKKCVRKELSKMLSKTRGEY
jgi:hypothetical protein